MALVRNKVTFITPEGSKPPGSIVEIGDDEVAGLVPGLAELVEESAAACDVEQGSEDGQEGGEGSDGASGGSEGAGDDAGGLGTGQGGEGDDGDGETRVSVIVRTIDLLDPAADFVKTGARAGKPKVKPLADALGFEPTVEEIDAALAVRAAG